MFSNKIDISLCQLSLFCKPNSIASHYIKSYDEVESFYEYDYRSLDNILEVTKKINLPSEHRKKLHKVLADYNQKHNNSPKVLENIDALLDQDCYTIFTGQQCGLMTGPLFTIYKAITAIKLAEKLNKLGKAKFVPVFWSASEDHDLAEVNQIIYPNIKGELESSSLDLSDHGYSVKDVQLNGEMESLLAQIKQSWHDTEFSQSIFDLLSNNTDSLSNSFSHLISYLFKDYGLIIVEPHILRELSVIFNQVAIEKNSEINYLLGESARKLYASNYSASINVSDSLNLFYYHDKKRTKLHWEESCRHYYIKDDPYCLTFDQLIKQTEQEPHLFSHNVVLRPIVQDTLFPNTAYVGGPGEILYFAQLKDIYPLFDNRMPVIYPRATITLFEKKFQKIQKRFDLTIEEILNYEFDEKLKDFFQPFENDSAINQFTTHMEKEIAELMLTAENKGKNIVESIKPSIRKIEFEVKRVKEKYLKKMEENLGISKNQIEKLRNGVIPKLKPQERVFNYFYYMNFYGPDLLTEIMNQVDITNFSHQVLIHG